MFRGKGRPSDTRECVEDVVDGEDITVIVDNGIIMVDLAEYWAGLRKRYLVLRWAAGVDEGIRENRRGTSGKGLMTQAGA